MQFKMVLLIVLLFTSMVLVQAEGTSTSQCRSLSMRDLSGTSHTLDDFKGKAVVLHFFSTWCMTCKAEMTSLEKMQGYLGDRDIVVLGVSPYDEEAALRPFAKEKGLSFPVVADTEKILADCFQVKAIPVSFLIDKSGTTTQRLDGPVGWESTKLVRQLDSLSAN